MVISSRTVISFLAGLGLIGVLIVIGIGNYLYDRIWPCPPQMVCWVDDSTTPGGEVVGLLVLALIIGAFFAAVRSLVLDNRAVRIGSGAEPVTPNSDRLNPPEQ
jgi:hypothetical protein